MKLRYNRILFSILVFVPFFITMAQDNESDIDKEIIRIRKELASVVSQRRDVKSEMEKDAREFAEYSKRTRIQLQSRKREIDSLKMSTTHFRLRNDSLSSIILALESSGKQTDLMQDNFRTVLIERCDKLLSVARNLPPMVSKNLYSTLMLLKSELDAKNIDNMEATQRMSQIIRDIDESTVSIQIVQGASPVAEISGTSYRLRIGSFFEAAVNAEATRYSLWKGTDESGKENWVVFNDASTAASILKSINIREGKALPGLVSLPLTYKLRSN